MRGAARAGALPSTRAPLAIALLCASLGCGAAPDPGGDAGADAPGCDQGDVRTIADGRSVGGHYITRVVSFSPGPGAGFGAAGMPEVVMGPPQGFGSGRGSTDVVSLGAGGEIVVGFDVDVVDGPGADLVVFENAFAVPGSMERYWEELGEVSVSLDGVTWTRFPCDAAGPRPHTGCAGWNPVYSAPESGYCATDPRVSGGDAFDLAAVGVGRARYLRIRDLRTQGPAGDATGFDLDAAAVVHAAPR